MISSFADPAPFLPSHRTLRHDDDVAASDVHDHSPHFLPPSPRKKGTKWCSSYSAAEMWHKETEEKPPPFSFCSILLPRYVLSAAGAREPQHQHHHDDLRSLCMDKEVEGGVAFFPVTKHPHKHGHANIADSQKGRSIVHHRGG